MGWVDYLIASVLACLYLFSGEDIMATKQSMMNVNGKLSFIFFLGGLDDFGWMSWLGEERREDGGGCSYHETLENGACG